MAKTLLEAVLRRAILQGGSIGYNPDMYDYGFADNIPPSEEFNANLRNYGTLHYSNGGASEYDTIWSSFTIDERGRQYIKDLDQQKNDSSHHEAELNCEIENLEQTNEVKPLQTEIEEDDSSSGIAYRIGKGCLFAIFILLLYVLKTCSSAFAKLYFSS